MRDVSATTRGRGPTHLGKAELLLDIADGGMALLADEGAVDELRADLAGAGDSARDGDELADLLGAEVADARDEGHVVKGDGELARHEAGRGRADGMGIGVEVVGCVLLDEILQGDAEVGQEPVGRPLAPECMAASWRAHR